MAYYGIAMMLTFILGLYKDPRGHALNNRVVWITSLFLITVFIGLRHKVGMDWSNYLIHFARVQASGINYLQEQSEWLYYIVMVISDYFGWGIHGANLISTAVFCLGLFAFCSMLPNRWAGLLAAFPICIIVFAMSANRQAMALGVILYMFSIWGSSSVLKKALLIGIAAMIHNSAILMSIFLVFDSKYSLPLKIFFASSVAILVLFITESSDKFDYYNQLYGFSDSVIRQKIAPATGALPHVLFNAGPGALILWSYYKKGWARALNPVYIWMSVLCIILLPLTFVATHAASRISMYFFPVSFVFFGCIPIMAQKESDRKMIYFCSGLFLIAVAYFWLIFSNSGFAHQNYQNILFVF